VTARSSRLAIVVLVAAALALASTAFADSTAAEPTPPGIQPAPRASATALPTLAEVLARVNGRPQGRSMSQRIAAELVDRNGTSRERAMRIFRRNSEGEVRTALFFSAPASLAGTALLVRDYAEDGRDDGLWLYLPAMRNVRRISSSGRGQGFFDTDFTYVEIATDTRLRIDLLNFDVTGREDLDGVPCLRLRAVPIDDDLAREVGYVRADYWIDEAAWVPRRVLLQAEGAKPLKEIRFDDLREDGGYLTVHRRSAVQFGSGHRTTLTSSEVRYDVELPEALFTESGLSHGPPPR